MRFTILLAATLLSVSAMARGLDDGDVVDAVMLHDVTGKPALVLSVDRPLETAADELKLDYKIGTYVGFVRSGELYNRYPKAKREEKPMLIFVFEDLPSPGIRDKAFAARERLVEMGFDVELKVYDEKAQKNVDLAP